jgi:VIT1/CCC1 family predicted Fe2+/Mn2+ transporter
MRSTVWKGVGFGLTSGVITTLGVIVGLHSATQSRLAVLAGIAVLAVSDALSDAMGIHVSEEAETEHTTREIWETSLLTFLSKLLVSLTFIVPVSLLELYTSILTSAVWGMLLITVFSALMAKSQNQARYWVVAEHLLIACLVVVIAHYLGDLVYSSFAIQT